MQRVLIIGSGGAGKSTLARALASKLGLPLIHLDQEFWRTGWAVTPRPEWRERVSKLIEADAWIMDGNFDSTLELRIPRADTIIFLNVPNYLCLWRLIKRRIQFHGRARPDMTSGCIERLDLIFAKWIWRYPKDAKPNIESLLLRYSKEKLLVVLQN